VKTEVPVVEPVDNEVRHREHLRIRKVTVRAFEGRVTTELTVLVNLSAESVQTQYAVPIRSAQRPT
jgi:hypothetical protein